MKKGTLISVPSIGPCWFIKKTYHGWRWIVQEVGKDKYHDINPMKMRASILSRRLKSMTVFRPFVDKGK